MAAKELSTLAVEPGPVWRLNLDRCGGYAPWCSVEDFGD